MTVIRSVVHTTDDTDRNLCIERGLTLITSVMDFISEKTKPLAENADAAVAVGLVISIFLPFYFSVAAVCLIAIMTMMNYNARVKALSAPYTKFLLGFLVVPFFISATFSNYWGMIYEMVLIAAVICGFYVRSIMTQSLFNQMLDAASIASIWCVGIAVYQKASVYATAPTYRPISVFHNANTYGMIIEFVVIIALYRIFTNPRMKLFYMAVIGLNLIGLYLSASVSAFAATGCAIMTMLIIKKQYKVAGGLVLAGVLFLTAGVLIPGIFPRGILAIDTTCSQRLSIWTTAIKGIFRNPLFGTGALSYQMIYSDYGGYKTYHCHNLLLDTLLNYGFAGLCAIGVYAIAQLKLLSLRFKNNICNDMNILVAAALVAIVVHGMTDVTIFWIQTGMLFLLMYASTGIGSEELEKNIRIPSILPEYSEDLAAQPLYVKN